jgi:hypothetical protein
MAQFDGKKAKQHRDLRSEIAYQAARLISEDGFTSVLAAKQKAARLIGVTERGLLPDNAEIEGALRSYQSLFHGDSQPLECRQLRVIAVDVMYRLRRFTPFLVGAVLNGSANRFSPIELEVVEIDTKQLEMFFLNERIHFETRIKARSSRRRGEAPCEVWIYEILHNESPVSIALYPNRAAMGNHYPRKGARAASAKLEEVEALLG